MKRSIALTILFILLAAAAIAEQAPAETSNTEKEKNMNPTFVIEMENGGKMSGELYPDIAPESVGNFTALANSGFYDGLIFHRVIPGFMIQGGDPKGNGTGGPGYCIKGEFAANGVQNDLHHERGVISMARASYSYDSAGSQFFICQNSAGVAHLDGQYAAFGRVLTGMEVVDAIAAVETGAGNKPVEDVVIKSVTVAGPELPEPDKLPGR